MAWREDLVGVVEPALAAIGLSLYDLDLGGSGRSRTLRVFVEREGGVDLAAITAASEALSRRLDRDAVAERALAGTYTLEVSSPGLERPLRTPAHFRGAVGSVVTVKTRAADGSRSRHRGLLVDTTDAVLHVETDDVIEPIPLADVVEARTVFEWIPTPPRRSGLHANERPRERAANAAHPAEPRVSHGDGTR